MSVKFRDIETTESVAARFSYKESKGNTTVGQVLQKTTATARGLSSPEYSYHFDVPPVNAETSIMRITLELVRLQHAGKIPRIR
jgi:hypothetical protein